MSATAFQRMRREKLKAEKKANKKPVKKSATRKDNGSGEADGTGKPTEPDENQTGNTGDG